MTATIDRPGVRIAELETPMVAIDLDRVDRNIAALQSYCERHGLANRPHIKTHKLPMIAHRQLAAGAAGITVQKLGEAEVMVAAGIDDILITFDLIGVVKAERLARIARLATVQVALDNEVALDTVASAAARAQREIGVLIEFESTKQRQGVHDPATALALARRAESSGHLRFRGLMTYPSSPYSVAWIASARELFQANGIEIEKVSGGGTPEMWKAHEIAGLTEYRAGTYVYHDRRTVGSGVASLDDCALHVHATVVSAPSEHRVVIDAGSKSLTSDLVPGEIGEGHGLILEHPEAVIVQLSEEHGVVDVSACSTRPAIGDRVRIVPNHVCPVSNLFDEVHLHRDGILEAVLPVAARGKVR
ncbi:MAG: alanine racemase [Trueperaceae bacterium]